jgi:hypothetical protein
MSVAVAIVVVVSCSGQEQQVLSNFFEAVKGGDAAVLASVSLAAFEGGVETWELVEMGPESVAPFELPGLHEQLMKKRSEIKIENGTNANYAGDHRELFDEYKKKKAEDTDSMFEGELGEFQTEWEKRMEAQSKLEEEEKEITAIMDDLKSAAGLSLSTSINEKFAGDVKGKELHLKVNDGSAEKGYVFMLKRYELADKERNITPISRWIITEIKEQV